LGVFIITSLQASGGKAYTMLGSRSACGGRYSARRVNRHTSAI